MLVMLDHQYNLILLIVIGIFTQMVVELQVVISITHLHLMVLLPLVLELMFRSFREGKMREVLTKNYTNLELLFQKNLIMQRIQKKDLFYKSQDQPLQEQTQTFHYQQSVTLIMTTNVITDS